MSNILSKFKQNLISDLIDSIESPVIRINIDAGGAGYANGDALVFDGVGVAAEGAVFTNGSGEVTHIAIQNGGNYVVTPNVSIFTIGDGGGTGAALTAELNNDHFYVFAGRSKPYSNENTPDPNYENDYDGFFFVHEQMMFGKKLTRSDISFMVRKSFWENGVVYSEYDDKDITLPTKPYYVITSDNGVYKCIYNNNNAPSTVEPTGTQYEGLPTTLSDGYRWKYLYTITGSDNTRFSTQNFVPVKKNDQVVAGALPGSILNIKVVSGGVSYPANDGQIATVNGNRVTIALGASAQTNYYASSTITVFGAGNLVTNARITESYLEGAEKVIILANTFNANQISQGYSYSIGPTLRVNGDGEGFEGYFVMNQTNKSIISAEVVNAGSGYNQATISAISGAGFGSGADLRAVISPKGGHGSDVFGELYCAHVGITGEFSNGFSFPTEVTLRTVGLLKNPTVDGDSFTELAFNQCANVSVSNTTSSNFDEGETVIGNVSQARGQVAFSNSSLLIITGYSGSFINGEVINGVDSEVQFIVNGVTSSPTIDVYSGEVLYIQNISPTDRSPTSSEQIKLVIRL